MTPLTMTLNHRTVAQNAPIELGAGCHAIRVLQGTLQTSTQTIATGEGAYATAGEHLSGAAEFLQFTLCKEAAPKANLMVEEFQFEATKAILRLDQVSFPPGAIAYRHIHAGPGIRCLIAGELTIHADHHVETLTPFNPWFEAASSPVKAVASAVQESSFVRAILLPVAYAGKPTITYLNAEDEAKPRLQSNHRFFDQILDLERL